MMRPITIIQAVGAFLVGKLVLVSSQNCPRQPTNDSLPLSIMLATISIYLSYGAGMAMNDIADRDIDAMHADKQDRCVASNAISKEAGCIFCAALAVTSIVFAHLAERVVGGGRNGNYGPCFHVGGNFVGWTVLNVALMTVYALGAQKLFLIKNISCGILAISPLVGASALGKTHLVMRKGVMTKLYHLASVGFPLQVSREILKDCEDTEIDQGVKQTLPLLVGKRRAKHVAYSLVLLVNAAIILSPYYWKMFASRPPTFAFSVVLGSTMCIIASRLPLAKGQSLLKKSIYVFLSGMISSLLLQ